MKKILLLISIFMISCMTGCGTKEQIEYAQSQLPKPDRIEVRRGDSIVTYENDSDKYQQIYESLSANWWKTAEDKAYSINEQDMTAVRNLKEERTTSKDRFAGDVEACIRLLYEDSPMLWTKSSVLDAGYGGKDPGANFEDIFEKDITLNIALYTQEILENSGYKVAMTRSDDTFVELTERPVIANQKNADVFVSIHCNSSEDGVGKGIETYYTEQKGEYQKKVAEGIAEGIINYLTSL